MKLSGLVSKLARSSVVTVALVPISFGIAKFAYSQPAASPLTNQVSGKFVPNYGQTTDTLNSLAQIPNNAIAIAIPGIDKPFIVHEMDGIFIADEIIEKLDPKISDKLAKDLSSYSSQWTIEYQNRAAAKVADYRWPTGTRPDSGETTPGCAAFGGCNAAIMQKIDGSTSSALEIEGYLGWFIPESPPQSAWQTSLSNAIDSKQKDLEVWRVLGLGEITETPQQQVGRVVLPSVKIQDPIEIHVFSSTNLEAIPVVNGIWIPRTLVSAISDDVLTALQSSSKLKEGTIMLDSVTAKTDQ